MHRKNFWTNKWMQEPRNNFYRLQVHQYNLSAQYGKDWGSFKIKRGLTLCYNWRRSGHLAKEFPGAGPICLHCKSIGHEVEDCLRMIAKVEKMNKRQENYKEGRETEKHTEKESETMLI
jgi:hypothetical protein